MQCILHSSFAVDLYASKQMRDCIARLMDYLWKTPGAPHTSNLAESRKALGVILFDKIML